MAILTHTRIQIEVLKRLVRVAHNLEVVKQEKYVELELDLEEISKMVNGWIKYLQIAPK